MIYLLTSRVKRIIIDIIIRGRNQGAIHWVLRRRRGSTVCWYLCWICLLCSIRICWDLSKYCISWMPLGLIIPILPFFFSFILFSFFSVISSSLYHLPFFFFSSFRVNYLIVTLLTHPVNCMCICGIWYMQQHRLCSRWSAGQVSWLENQARRWVRQCLHQVGK